MQNKNGALLNKIQGNAQKDDILVNYYSIYCTVISPRNRKEQSHTTATALFLRKSSWGLTP